MVLSNNKQGRLVNLDILSVSKKEYDLILEGRLFDNNPIISTIYIEFYASEDSTMSSIPQGMFCAMKVRENQDLMRKGRKNNGESNSSPRYYNTKLMELAPLKYNSKLMNSIWGLYNRYSPHNIKKTTDVLTGAGDLQESNAGLPIYAGLESAVLDGANKQGANKPATQNMPKMDNIWPNLFLN